MALTCGLAFSGMGLAERTLELPDPWWHVLGDPTLYALLGYGAVGITAYASAIARGKVTTVTAVTFAVETLVPSVIGLVALDDSPRPGSPSWRSRASRDRRRRDRPDPGRRDHRGLRPLSAADR